MSDEDIELGQHLWALSRGQLLVVMKTPHCYEVCGGWEGGMSFQELELISLIERPACHLDTKLYYL